MKPETEKSKFGTVAIVVTSIGLGFFIICGFGAWVYANSYGAKVFPGISIGQYQLGGLTRNEIINLIETINNRYSKEGIDLRVKRADKVDSVKIPTISSTENAVEIIKIDSEKIADQAIAFGKNGNFFEKIYLPLLYKYKGVQIEASAEVNEFILEGVLRDSLNNLEDRLENASIEIVDVKLGKADITPEKNGFAIDYEKLVEKIFENVNDLSFKPIEISLELFDAEITSNQLKNIIPKIPGFFDGGEITISATTTSGTKDWVLQATDLAKMTEVIKHEDKLIFSLNKEKVFEYFSDIVSPEVDIPAEDGKFTIEDNKVKEFRTSKEGFVLNKEKSFEALNELFKLRNYSSPTSSFVTLTQEIELPKVSTENVNSLGIVELIGTGTSTFKDSHTRRIKNIALAVEKLNGTLIKPGEEFSSIKFVGPFTAENGYLPEQVIVGRTIKEEIGGGMCQIGTTLFRMAMQSGLPITERHNHSLVVSYYADPVNGNPGTDATLYEPTLDFKFVNDTDNYLLLLTEIDYKKQLLTFSLWGTNDGRSGWYSRPLVSKWVPHSKEVEYVYSTKLKPGEEKCQNAFNGAFASFTYTRITPEGEKIEKVYNSYYRPLPKICTVGPTSTPQFTTSASSSDQVTPSSTLQ